MISLRLRGKLGPTQAQSADQLLASHEILVRGAEEADDEEDEKEEDEKEEKDGDEDESGYSE